MSQKLTYNPYKPPAETQSPSTTTAYLPDIIYGMFSAAYNYCTHVTPTFDPDRYQILPLIADPQVAEDYIQKEFLPRFEFAEREIERLPSSNSLREALHLLYSLSLMERGIQKWKERHIQDVTQPRAVHTLYKKLFDKAEAPSSRPLPALTFKSFRASSFPLLLNTSGTNCFMNVTIQTLFSNPELAEAICYSERQAPEVREALFDFQTAI